MSTLRMPLSSNHSRNPLSNVPGAFTLSLTPYSKVPPAGTVICSWCFELKQQLTPHPSAKPMIRRGTLAGLVIVSTRSCSPTGQSGQSISSGVTVKFACFTGG